jgi:nucleotide-binding universal stress UspA family protein
MVMENIAINTILVPVDYSETSLNALEYAAKMTQVYQANLHIIHVIDPDIYLTFSPNGIELDLTQETIVEREEKKLQALADDILTQYQISVSHKCVTGNVVNLINEEATNIQCDLIIMGTHGLSGIKSFFMGTNAYDVSKKAICPVLTVPDNKKWIHLKRILFPIRSVPNALEKYTFARKIIGKYNAELIVLALLDDDSTHKTGYLDVELKALYQQLQTDNINSYSIFTYTDSVAYTALRKAEELAVDLMIITADFDTSIESFFTGPYTQQVLNHANVPVLSIKPKSHPVIHDTIKTPNIYEGLY